MFCSCTYRNHENILSDCGLKVTYNSQVRKIIEKRCAISGCHVNGFHPGDYTSYAGVKKNVDSGKFKLRVFGNSQIPPTMPPFSKPQLGEEELQILKCWLDQDALEN